MHLVASVRLSICVSVCSILGARLCRVQQIVELLSTLCRRQCRDNREFSTVDKPLEPKPFYLHLLNACIHTPGPIPIICYHLMRQVSVATTALAKSNDSHYQAYMDNCVDAVDRLLISIRLGFLHHSNGRLFLKFLHKGKTMLAGRHIASYEKLTHKKPVYA